MSVHVLNGTVYDKNTGLYKARCSCGAMSSHARMPEATRGIESHIMSVLEKVK